MAEETNWEDTREEDKHRNNKTLREWEETLIEDEENELREKEKEDAGR